MTISAQAGDLHSVEADVVAATVFKGGIEGPGTADVLHAIGLDDFPVTPSFRGDVGQTLRLSATGQSFSSVLLVGLGRMDGVTPASLRRAAGEVAATTTKCGRLATTLAQINPTAAAIQAVADGLALGAYADSRFKSATEDDGSREAVLLVPSSLLSEADRAIEHSRITSAAVIFARDLVNTPPGQARPVDIAQMTVEQMPDEVSVTVHDQGWLEAHGCGGLLGVGRGSDAESRLVELTYEPDNPVAHIVLVGKGITFDSGGLNLKRGSSMAAMKSDMAGAAAVAAGVRAAAGLDSRIKITGLMALAENAIGGDAQRPSDVITTYDGTTVAVSHTDAEGRLVLADALGYAAAMSPDAIIDLATLTGAAVSALGPWTAALMGNDPSLVDDIAAAAEHAGEPVWPLPLPDDLDRWLDSPVADVDNLGRESPGGALTAGLFLRRFVGDVAWAHLDIAGPAFLEVQDARGHQPAGGTGFGVTTLVTLLQRHSG